MMRGPAKSSVLISGEILFGFAFQFSIFGNFGDFANLFHVPLHVLQPDPTPWPFSSFYCKQRDYSNRPLGGPCVALGWPKGGPSVAQGWPRRHPIPIPSRQRVATG